MANADRSELRRWLHGMEGSARVKRVALHNRRVRRPEGSRRGRRMWCGPSRRGPSRRGPRPARNIVALARATPVQIGQTSACLASGRPSDERPPLAEPGQVAAYLAQRRGAVNALRMKLRNDSNRGVCASASWHERSTAAPDNTPGGGRRVRQCSHSRASGRSYRLRRLDGEVGRLVVPVAGVQFAPCPSWTRATQRHS